MVENKTRIFLDHNATTAVKPDVIQAMASVMGMPLNASSVHGFGRDAKRLLSAARRNVAQMAGADGAEIIFTGSGTEANNLAIKGFKDAPSVLVSAIEHSCILKAMKERDGGIIPVEEDGCISLKALEKILHATRGKPLVSVMLVNNETGVIQPIEEVVALTLKYGGYVHCDASQAFGKIPVNFHALNVDMMTLSAHKFGGPKGVGALIMKKGLSLAAQIVGGGQESGFRAGTENIPAIVGLGVAVEDVGVLNSDLRDLLEREILEFAPETVIFGRNVQRLPNTSLIAMPGMDSQTQLINFDLAGIAVSSGSACSSGRVERSHVLEAMGVSRELSDAVVRVSLGASTTRNEVMAFVDAWKENYRKVSAVSSQPYVTVVAANDETAQFAVSG